MFSPPTSNTTAFHPPAAPPHRTCHAVHHPASRSFNREMSRPKRGLSEADPNTHVKVARTGRGGKTQAEKPAEVKMVSTAQTRTGRNVVAEKKTAAETKPTTKKTRAAEKKSATGNTAVTGNKTGTGTGKKVVTAKNAPPMEKTSTEKTEAAKNAPTTKSGGKTGDATRKVATAKAVKSEPVSYSILAPARCPYRLPSTNILESIPDRMGNVLSPILGPQCRQRRFRRRGG